MRKINLLLLTGFLLGNAFAGQGEGGDRGHGGDTDVVEFLKISEKICVLGGGDHYKKFSTDRCNEMINSFRESLNSSSPKLIFEDNPDLVKENEVQKESVYYPITSTITVSRQHWSKKNDREKNVLVGIELAGILGVYDRYGFGLLISTKWEDIARTTQLNSVSKISVSGQMMIVKSESIRKNPDNTVTISKPRLIRGDRSYSLISNSSSTSYSGICLALGFENFLNGAAFQTEEPGTEKAFIDSNGLYAGRDATYRHAISRITCYNGSYQPVMTIEKYIKNPDNTVTISKPKLIRGDRSYSLISNSSSTSYSGICLALGFENFLNGNAFQTEEAGTKKAFIDGNGLYAGRDATYKHALSRITCYSGANINVLIDEFGNQYIRRNTTNVSK